MVNIFRYFKNFIEGRMGGDKKKQENRPLVFVIALFLNLILMLPSTAHAQTVDNTPPTITFSPNDTYGVWVNTSPMPITITVADAESGVQKWRLKANDSVNPATWLDEYIDGDAEGWRYDATPFILPNISTDGQRRLQVEAIDNEGNSITTASGFYLIDRTPPVNLTDYPKADTATSDGFTVRAKINENGIAYYVVLPKESTTPTAIQVKEGLNITSQSAITSGNISLTANEENWSVVIGLTSASIYDVYFVAEDLAGNLTEVVKIRDLVRSHEVINSGRIVYDGDWENALQKVTFNGEEENYKETIGEYVVFGGITWRIIHTEGSQALLFSEEIIEMMEFDNDSMNDWQSSGIHAWLNADNGFLGSFQEYEKNVIVDHQYTALLSRYNLPENSSYVTSYLRGPANIKLGESFRGNFARNPQFRRGDISRVEFITSLKEQANNGDILALGILEEIKNYFNPAREPANNQEFIKAINHLLDTTDFLESIFDGDEEAFKSYLGL
jgi:hypothetical protein